VLDWPSGWAASFAVSAAVMFRRPDQAAIRVHQHAAFFFFSWALGSRADNRLGDAAAEWRPAGRCRRQMYACRAAGTPGPRWRCAGGDGQRRTTATPAEQKTDAFNRYSLTGTPRMRWPARRSGVVKMPATNGSSPETGHCEISERARPAWSCRSCTRAGETVEAAIACGCGDIHDNTMPAAWGRQSTECV